MDDKQVDDNPDDILRKSHDVIHHMVDGLPHMFLTKSADELQEFCLKDISKIVGHKRKYDKLMHEKIMGSYYHNYNNNKKEPPKKVRKTKPMESHNKKEPPKKVRKTMHHMHQKDPMEQNEHPPPMQNKKQCHNAKIYMKRNPDGTLILPCEVPQYRTIDRRIILCLGDGPLIKVHRADYYVRPGFKSMVTMKGITFFNSIHPPVRDDSNFPIFKVEYKKPNGDSGVISNEKAELMGKASIRKKYGSRPHRKKNSSTTEEIRAYNKRLWNDGIFETPAHVANAAYTLHNGWSTGAIITVNGWFLYEHVQNDILNQYFKPI